MPGSQATASRFAVMPSLAAGGRLGWARGAVGAALGIFLTAFITRLTVGPVAELPWLVAPLGASAVLIFVLPASPLAQPWPVAGGCLLSAMLGMVVHALVPDPLLAGTLAVGASIALMTVARCLHPPGGACALMMALGSPAIDAAGWSFLVLPLATNLVLMLVAGLLFNNLTGHRYPHHPKPSPILAPGTWAGTYTEDDLDAVLDEWDEVIDVSREDLDALFRLLEARVQRKWLDDHK